MDDPEKLKLRDLLGHFTTKQLWGAIAALLGLVAAAFGAGVWLSTQKSILDVASKEAAHTQQLQAKDDVIRKLKEEGVERESAGKARVSNLESQLVKTRIALDSTTKERAWLGLKAEFLEHYLRYELAMSSGDLEDRARAKSLFVGFVHRVWKAQEDSAVRLAMGSATTQSSLPIITRPGEQPPIIRKPTGTQQRVIKTITFPDKTTFTVPYPVASEVHRRE